MWAVLGRIRAYAGGLGSGSGPKLAVLGADQGLRGRSWEGSGRKVAQTRAGARSVTWVTPLKPAEASEASEAPYPNISIDI